MFIFLKIKIGDFTLSFFHALSHIRWFVLLTRLSLLAHKVGFVVDELNSRLLFVTCDVVKLEWKTFWGKRMGSYLSAHLLL